MKETWKIIIAIVITALIVGPLVYYLKPVPTAPTEEVSQLQSQISQLQSQISQLQSEISQKDKQIKLLQDQLATFAPGKGLRIYFVSNGRSVCDWWAEAKHGWDNMMEALGVSEYTMFFGEEDPSKEAAAFQSAIAAHPDLIVVSNAFPDVLNPLIDQALASGIKVLQAVVADPSIESKVPAVYFEFGEDMRQLAHYLAPMIKEKFGDRTINVLVGAMAPDSVYAVLRKQGFLQGLEEENIKYNVDVLPLGGEPAQIVEKLKSYLMGHKVDVYMGVDCDATDWIGPALKELGYKPGDIIACGADVLPHTADAIREGYVQAVVHMGQWAMLQFAALQAFLYAKYGYPPRNIGIPGIIVTTENLALFEKPW